MPRTRPSSTIDSIFRDTSHALQRQCSIYLAQQAVQLALRSTLLQRLHAAVAHPCNLEANATPIKRMTIAKLYGPFSVVSCRKLQVAEASAAAVWTSSNFGRVRRVIELEEEVREIQVSDLVAKVTNEDSCACMIAFPPGTKDLEVLYAVIVGSVPCLLVNGAESVLHRVGNKIESG